MSTQAQIDANRVNAQKSSGPVSEEGKANSSQNRATHRLSQYASLNVLDHEDELLYVDLTLKLIHQFKPFDVDEQAIVDRMAKHEWMRRRALCYQDAILSADNFNSDRMKLFMRYESQHERAYNSCLNQLLKIRAEKRSITIGSEREKQVKVQASERTQRHELTQKARQVDADCKIIRTLRTSANDLEALDSAREVKTRYQAA